MTASANNAYTQQNRASANLPYLTHSRTPLTTGSPDRVWLAGYLIGDNNAPPAKDSRHLFVVLEKSVIGDSGFETTKTWNFFFFFFFWFSRLLGFCYRLWFSVLLLA